MSYLKTTLFLFLVMVLFNSISYTQDDSASNGETDNAKVSIDDLRAPSCVAATLLGIEPSSVQTPSSPESITLNLYSNYESNFVPKDFAVEFSPYWFVSHSLTFNRYYESEIARNILKTTSLSIGRISEETTQTISGVEETTKITKIGLGISTQLFTGKQSSAMDSLIKEVEENDSKMLPFLREIVELEQTLKNPELTLEESVIYEMKISIDRKEIDTLEKKTQEIINKYQPVDKRPIGFILEIAGGSVFEFQNNEFENAKNNLSGIWVTPTYRLDKPKVDFVSLIRYFWGRNEDDFNHSLYFGESLVYSSSIATVSGEFIYRHLKTPSSNSNEYRYNLNFQYPLTKSILLTAAFGKDFSTMDDESGDMIARISLTYGHGQPELSVP